MSTTSLTAGREDLASLLEAVQRCAQEWPLDGHRLKQRRMDEALFEAPWPLSTNASRSCKTRWVPPCATAL